VKRTNGRAKPGQLLRKAALKGRIVLLILSAVITVAAAIGAPAIPFTADPTDYLPPDDPSVEFWLNMTHRFGALDLLMIGLEEPVAPLDPESLKSLKRTTDRLADRKGDGVLLARSLTNVMTIREGEDGTLNAEALADPLPDSPDAHAELSARILADGQIRGSLVSNDLMGYVVLVRTDPRKDSREVAALVKEIVEEEKGPLNATYFGAPFIAGMVTSATYDKLCYVVPLFVLLLFIPIFVSTRRFLATLLVFAVAGISLVWWLALLRVFSIELSATASSAALLLLSAGAIVFARELEEWFKKRGSGASDSYPLSGRMMVCLSGAAVALWALSFLSLPFISDFGTVSAVGMLALLACGVLLFAPAATWLSDRGKPGPRPDALRISNNTALIGVAVLVLLGTVGAAQSRFLISPRDMFSRNDEVGQAIDFLDRRFGGADILQIHVQGDFSKPAHCARLMRLTDLLEGSESFSDVRSLSQILGFLNEQFNGLHRIPRTGDELGNLWFFLAGSEDIRPLILDDRKEAMIAARISPAFSGNPAEWAATAERAVEQSVRADGEAARVRLVALRDRYEIGVSDERLNLLVSHALAGDKAGRRSDHERKVIEQLRQYMFSPESPFEPTAGEWKTMAGILEGATEGRRERLADAAAKMEGYKEMGYPPEVAPELADMLVGRYEELFLKLRSGELAGKLLSGLGQGKDVEAIQQAFVVRARGVFADLLGGHEPEADEADVTVSGFPAVVLLVEARLRQGIWLAAGILWLIMFIIALAATRRAQNAMRCALDALIASLLTFAVGWLLGVQLDSACATLYLVPPLAGFFISPRLSHASCPDDPGENRFARAVALGLALASLSLLVTGIMPVVRTGAVMALGLVFVAGISKLSVMTRIGK